VAVIAAVMGLLGINSMSWFGVYYCQRITKNVSDTISMEYADIMLERF